MIKSFRYNMEFFYNKYSILIIYAIILCRFHSIVPTFAIPVINSVTVINETIFKIDNETYVKFAVQFEGTNFSSEMKVKPTTLGASFGTECLKNRIIHPEFDNSTFVNIWSNNSLSFSSISFKYHSFYYNKNYLISPLNIYFCVSERPRTSNNVILNDNITKWFHQGEEVIFPKEALLDYNLGNPLDKPRRYRRQETVYTSDRNQGPQIPIAFTRVILYGIRLEHSDPEASYEEDGTGIPILIVGSEAVFRFFGTGWTSDTIFVLTEDKSHCEFIIGDYITVDRTAFHENDSSITLKAKMPAPSNGKRDATFYFCTRENTTIVTNGVVVTPKFVHLGSQLFLQIRVKERLIPIWSQFLIIIVCLCFSCLFSGLNLGLLSLNQTDLKIISNTGTKAERKYAKTIYPVRIHGNYLLCSILLGNVLVNSIFTILLDDMFSGMVAVIVSTLAIVICGEICPQAVCSRHGLAIGCKTIYITKTVMVLTFPLSWPISRALDWVLGEEITTIYTRERLKELVNLTTEYNDLEKDEVNIISGALELRKKTVAEVMTRIEDVYMLSHDTILDFETVSEIMKSGYSRIPIYENHRHNIVSLLYIKDLALIDPDDNTPLKTLSKFYQNCIYFVFEDTTLDVVFKQFKEGCKGHMAFVHRVNNEGSGDPFYETIGIVTLEDVIEELIQAEIMDETDVYTDNRNKQRRAERNVRSQDFSIFAERSENQRIHISPQLNLATFQFLSSSVDAFKPESISENVLLRLLKQDVIFHIKMKDKEKMKNEPAAVIYQQSKPADYFVLILEGRVEVTVGRENLVFESGPFTYFGSQALMQNIGVAESPTNAIQPLGSLQSVNIESMLRYTFIPDYTVRAVTEVVYLRIKRSFYLAAKKATLLEHSKKVSNAGEHFDNEVEKILHSYGKSGSVEEDAKSQASRDGSYSNAQTISFMEDSNRSTPLTQDVLNNGGISSTVSPSRTPRSSSATEEKITLLGTNLTPEDRLSS